MDPNVNRVKNIKVTYDKTKESGVYNDERLEKYESEDIYIPEMIFGSLLTSSTILKVN